MADYKEFGFQNNNPLYGWGYIQNTLLSLLDKTNNKCILDLGCGNGYFVNYLISKGFNAYGIDASSEGIGIAQHSNPDNFFVQDLSDSQLPIQIRHLAFDTIISTEVIEHLYNPVAFLDFCKNILSKTNGELIISTPYHGYLKNLMLSVFNQWDSHTHPLICGGHIKFWSRKTLTRLLTEAGFNVIAFKGCGRVPYLWKSMVIKANLA
ncbi:MAG: methyltransferase [Mucilaginibacter sp.]|nr:methyltransferase [Mucilaginibacter sp.]